MGQVLRLSPFGPISPRTAERLLPDTHGQTAANLHLLSGDIRPIREPGLVNSAMANMTSVYRAEHDGVEKWRGWMTDVDVARLPLTQDVEPRYVWTGDGQPKMTTFGNFTTPEADLNLGIPNPTAKPAVSVTGGTGATVSRVYVYTFFSQHGEESGPSPVSDLVSGAVDGAWTVSGMSAFPAPPWNVVNMKRRLYRSVGTSPSFQLVAENVGVSYVDTLRDSQIPGDELISEGWEPPPAGLFNITALPNGALVGLVGNLLCQSEPYQFHAWPITYQRGMNQTAVGLAAYGTTIVIGTKGAPFICDGVEPDSVTLERHDNIWPCLAKRSMISVGDGVIYSTLSGLVYIGSAGPRIWTQPYYTREEWILLDPYTLVCAIAENHIFILYKAVGAPKRSMLVFQPLEPLATLTTLTLNCNELYADPRNGFLYVVDNEGVKQYDSADGARLPFEWLSKEFELPAPCNFGAARVEFVSEQTAADVSKIIEDYENSLPGIWANLQNGENAINGGRNRSGEINGGVIGGYSPRLDQLLDAQKSVTFTLYARGVMKFSKTLYEDISVFRLPSGYMSDVYSVKLNGQVRVHNAKVAETPDELRRV